MWFGVWAGKRGAFLLDWRHKGKILWPRPAQERWRKFVERYHKFLREDTLILCDRHHAEIHDRYDKIIERHKQRTGKNLAAYSWNDAEDLMNELEAECLKWLEKKTPGIKPSTLDARRARKRKRRR